MPRRCSVLTLLATVIGLGVSACSLDTRPLISSSQTVGSTHRHHAIDLSPGKPGAEQSLVSAFDDGRGREVLTFRSRPLRAPFLFDEALVSWNLRLEPSESASIFISVRPHDSASWTAPMLVGTAGPAPLERPMATVVAPQRVDVDYLISDVPCAEARVEVRIDRASRIRGSQSHDIDFRGETRPIERLDLVLSAVNPDPDLPLAVSTGPEALSYTPSNLPVPFRSQRSAAPALAGRICSPTSVNMVLAFWGKEMPLEALAAAAHDPVSDLYGNWPRNIQAAYRAGVQGRIARFSLWDEVASTLASGRPIIISIATKPGELPEAPYDATDGHLLVLRGMTAAGDLLVCDPAAPDAERGCRTYRRDHLSRVWLQRNRGTAYLIGPPVSLSSASLSPGAPARP